MAQVATLLAAMALAVLPVPRSTEERLAPISFAPSPRLFVSPKPNCPASFLPQHLTELFSKMVQVCSEPAVVGNVVEVPKPYVCVY